MAEPSFPVLYDLLIPGKQRAGLETLHRRDRSVDLTQACLYVQSMEAALKAQNLGSAKVRRLRVAERETQKQIIREQREERRQRVLRYSNAYHTDEEHNSRPTTPEQGSSVDSSVRTPSEYSVGTPEPSDSPETGAVLHVADLMTQEPGDMDLLQEEQQQQAMQETSTLNKKITSQTEKPIMFTASLSRPCDYRYDRFSTIMDIPPVQRPLAEVENNSDSEDDDELDYSPIEVATPVVFCTPINKPAVVSVAGTVRSVTNPKRISVATVGPRTSLTPKNTPPVPNLRALPTPPLTEANLGDQSYFSRRGHYNGELTPSTISLASTSTSPADSTNPGSYPFPSDNSMRKRSNMPMLSKLTHARMSSIKNFIKPQSISGPPPSVPQVPIMHQSRPSTSVTNLLAQSSSLSGSRAATLTVNKTRPASPLRSMTEPVWLKSVDTQPRPQTARTSSRTDVTASALTDPMPTMPSVFTALERDDDIPSMNRKKSFSNLRRRSGSLGQALKGLGSTKSKTPSQDQPMPAMPILDVPTHEPTSATSMSGSTKSFKGSRKSGMLYSPFPSMTKSESVGLGLRMS